MTTARAMAELKRELKSHFLILAAFLSVMWTLEIIDVVVGGAVDRFCGITPRTAAGVKGILLHPFAHFGFPHLVSNSVAFVVLGWITMVRERWHFFAAAGSALLVGGLGVWLFGQLGLHAGASGVIFGFFGFVVLAGWFDRRPGAILLSVVVGLTYGTMLFGVLPQPGISWEGHLFGFVGGGLAAWLVARANAGRPNARG